ncbi:MAG: ABC transporter ATP-binding protein [Dehalococcoidia bacterium]|nr:ABC transporter ATP-binding protein [Dehalococcoidia bacterium]
MSKLVMLNAQFKYGKTVVLSDVNFETHPGEFLGIIGPNGSGKSTLLKGMANLIRASNGSIMLDGINISNHTRTFIAQRIAFVPQYAVLPDLFTVIDIVLMGRTPHLGLLRYESSKDINIALKALDVTHTAHLANKRINQISGGERQRVLIARALAQEATILLLDEPTANLDINYQAEVLNFLIKLCRDDNFTVVAALHDLNLASQYCSQIIMLKQGQVWKCGKPSDIINSDSINDVFGTVSSVQICRHPANGLPAVLLTPSDTNGSK